MPLPIIGSVLDLGKTLVEKLIPDPKAKAEAYQKLAELEQSGELKVIEGQVEINKIEAASTNMFIAGWRPFLGWTCAATFAMALFVFPMLYYGASVVGRPIPPPPKLDTEQVTTLLVGMLGLGGMRTMEKMTKTEGNR